MIFNEALIANSQLKLFAVLAGVVLALLTFTFMQIIALFFQLSHLFCIMKMIMSFAKNKLTFSKTFDTLSYSKSKISLFFYYIVFQHTQKLIFTHISIDIANSNPAYMIINAIV
jgi:hypothetical protein